MPVVWTDDHRLHDPGGEIWVGVHTPGTEVPARVQRIREALEAEGAELVEAQAQTDDALNAVHDEQLTSHRARAWDDWERARLTEDPGQNYVVPYLFPTPTCSPPGARRPPRTSPRARGCSPTTR
jgi:acetoin utilization deacetylase AcuC-like enzyme